MRRTVVSASSHASTNVSGAIERSDAPSDIAALADADHVYGANIS
jgi:hypothetical protein